MRVWPFNRAAGRDATPSPGRGHRRLVWDDDPAPLDAEGPDDLGGGGPRFLERRGPARIYDDEIDPGWADPLTELDEEDED